MEQKLERLPDAERDVMLVLWKYHSPVRTVRIWQDVSQTHDWTLSTLKVLLGRLTDKGFVELTRQGRFTLYQALVSEAEYCRQETKGLLSRYYQNSVKSMIAALVEEETLSGEDLSELEELIRKAGKTHDA